MLQNAYKKRVDGNAASITAAGREVNPLKFGKNKFFH